MTRTTCTATATVRQCEQREKAVAAFSLSTTSPSGRWIEVAARSKERPSTELIKTTVLSPELEEGGSPLSACATPAPPEMSIADRITIHKRLRCVWWLMPSDLDLSRPCAVLVDRLVHTPR